MLNLINRLRESDSFTISQLLTGIASAPISYKVYKIKKRSGGERIIAQPSKFVKLVQKEIVSNFLSDFSVSDESMAYVEGRSIIDNAKAHKESKWILKMDFKDFFPSIKPNDLFLFLKRENIELSDFDKRILKSFLFRKNGSGFELSIGAPSSPLVSNLVMKEFDGILNAECNNLGVGYTRYADDLTFSSDDFDTLSIVKEHVLSILDGLKSPTLKINENKTRVVGEGRSKRITGIVITHDREVSIGRYKRKKIRAMLNHYANKTINVDHVPYLHGIISHARFVEPEFFNKLLEKYGEDFFKSLAKHAYKLGEENRAKAIF